MEQSPSWEANTSSTSQEIHGFLRNPKVHSLVQKSPSPVPILSQINPFHVPSHFLNIHFNIILPSTPRSSKWPLSIIAPHQNRVYIFHVFHTYYICRPSHSSDFTTLILFVEKQRTHRSLLIVLLALQILYRYSCRFYTVTAVDPIPLQLWILYCYSCRFYTVSSVHSMLLAL